MAGIDGRSRGARRLRDLIEDLTQDLGGGLGEAERLQVRTVASVILASEQMTAAVIRGETVDAEQMTRTANAAARLLASLRAKQSRRQAPSGDPLGDYLSAKAKAEAAA